ncbi:MAG: nuclear transport factor 2 family protein [Mycobacterium sp.]
MKRARIIELWERHARYEFETKDADAAVSTMVSDATVMHLPTMSGAAGREALRQYYRSVFIPAIPDGTVNEPVARFVGDDFLVDQAIMKIRHDREIPYLLPGLAPTGIALEVPFAVFVTFRDGLMSGERLYWDHAQVLAQLGVVHGRDLAITDPSAVTTFLRQAAVRRT